MDHFVESSVDCKKETDVDIHNELKQKAFKKWCACVFSKQCDDNECGTVKKNLQSQCALGDDQHPSSVTKVTDVLTNHSWDETCDAKAKKDRAGNIDNDTESAPAVEKEADAAVSLAQTSGTSSNKEHATCLRCG